MVFLFYMKNPDFKIIADRIKEYLYGEMPAKAGAMAVEHFDLSFENKGFTDKTLSSWKPVRDRKSKKDKERPLVESGRMRRSIGHRTEGSDVVIFSDVEYAGFHNDGGSVPGRPPQRQFIGSSEVLEQKIEDMIFEDVDKIAIKVRKSKKSNDF